MCPQAKQLGIVELNPGIVPHLEGDVETVTRRLPIASGGQYAGQHAVVEGEKRLHLECTPRLHDRGHGRDMGRQGSRIAFPGGQRQQRPSSALLAPADHYPLVEVVMPCQRTEFRGDFDAALRLAGLGANQRIDRSPIAQTEGTAGETNGMAAHFHLLEGRLGPAKISLDEPSEGEE